MTDEQLWKNRLKKAVAELDKYSLNKWLFIYTPLTRGLREYQESNPI